MPYIGSLKSVSHISFEADRSNVCVVASLPNLPSLNFLYVVTAPHEAFYMNKTHQFSLRTNRSAPLTRRPHQPQAPKTAVMPVQMIIGPYWPV